MIDRIDAAARAGFKAIEMHWPYDLDAADARARCLGHGVDLLAINTHPGNISTGDLGLGAVPGREVEFQAAIDQSIGFCVESGATAIHCMAGIIAPERKLRATETFIWNLRAAAAKAEVHGLTLLLEPLNAIDVPGYFYSSPTDAVEIARATGCPNVRLMFDCYHVGRSGLDVIAMLELCLPMIGHVQIASVPARAEPDAGMLDYAEVFDALDTLGYDGWVGCEYRPATTTDEGMRWVRALGATL